MSKTELMTQSNEEKRMLYKFSSELESYDTVLFKDFLNRFKNARNSKGPLKINEKNRVFYIKTLPDDGDAYELKELDNNGVLIRKTIYYDVILEDWNESVVSYELEEYVNDYFKCEKKYNQFGKILSKEIKSYFGFSIGNLYRYDQGGDFFRLDSVNLDDGYSYNHLYVFEFCRKKGMDVNEKKNMNKIRIGKFKTGDSDLKQFYDKYDLFGLNGSHSYWHVEFKNHNYSGSDLHYFINASNGKVVKQLSIEHQLPDCSESKNNSSYHFDFNLTPFSENIDTSFYNSMIKKMKSGVKVPFANPKDSFIKAASIDNSSFKEYDVNGCLSQSTTLKDFDGYRVELFLDSYFTCFKYFGTNNLLFNKYIESGLGFKIGKEFLYNEDGQLTQIVDHDSGYNYSYNSVIQFCENNCIELRKKGYKNSTKIYKFKYGFNSSGEGIKYGGTHNGKWGGRPCWLIISPVKNSSLNFVLVLDGKNGKVLHKYYSNGY